jgi:hypothetical protein
LSSWTEVRKNDPKLPGTAPTTGMKPTRTSPPPAGVCVGVVVDPGPGVRVFVAARVIVIVGVRVTVFVTVGLADALGVTVIVRVTEGVAVWAPAVWVGVTVVVATAVTVVVGVPVGVPVGVCARAVHKPNAAKRSPPPTKSRSLFARAWFPWKTKPLVWSMDPSGGLNALAAMGGGQSAGFPGQGKAACNNRSARRPRRLIGRGETIRRRLPVGG